MQPFRRISFSAGLIGFTAFSAAWMPRAGAQALWYNGDYAGSGLSNGTNVAEGTSLVFDDFTVADANGWHITSLFSNDQMDTAGITQAQWSIRSGLSVGDGGTVLFSGTSTATQTLRDTEVGPGYNEYQILVSGLNIDLGPGTYWLQVSPIGTGFESSFVSSTVGTNAVGLPAGSNGAAYFQSDYFGADFSATTDIDISLHDFSMGVNGTVRTTAPPVPAPSSLTPFVGAAGLAFATRFRRRKCRLKAAPAIL